MNVILVMGDVFMIAIIQLEAIIAVVMKAMS